jgi:hypothetical protein
MPCRTAPIWRTVMLLVSLPVMMSTLRGSLFALHRRSPFGFCRDEKTVSMRAR